ncbi:MAG: hypothetical protein BMS9Abin01_0067 [Gammaproteobacteria bacterium]|nr:MAG: hypothetical protein BMS9Abin01_0067 [Gammaproteobacteria bacterium]
MREDHPSKTPTDAWQAGWKDNERAQLRSWLKATPAQRLHWLEEAIKLAYQAGALRPGQ